MATNSERVSALLDALYDGPLNPAKTKKVVNAVIEQLQPEQIEAQFPGATLNTLTAEQKAHFVIESFKDSVRNWLTRGEQAKVMKERRAAREAEREAARNATAGF